MDIGQSLETLRERLDAFVIGQSPVKEALLLALIAQEHLYLEGEPGCAKTLLAEVAGNTANLRFHFSQMHRDTRLHELVGDVVLKRESLGEGKGERIRQGLNPGGVLTAELVLLDDISRAPGEALNVLLRILNERQFETYTLPLMSAIATSNPTGTEYYNEPLDPANLDRFTLQMKTKGALACRNWEEARTIIDRYDGTAPDMSDSAKITADTLRLARGLSRRVRLPDTVLAAYLKVLHTLRNRHGCTEKNSLLTDRTMLIKVPRMIRALALLEGRKEAVPEDLRVLKYILTFRVPEKVYEQLDDILAEVLQDPAQEPPPPPEDSEQNQGLQGMDDSEGEGQDAEMTEGEGEQDMIDQLLNALEGEGEEAQRKQAAQQQASTPQDGKGKVERIQPQTVEHLDMLMEQISGRLERNWADSEVHPGGSPRSYRRMKTFEEFTDTDPGDTAIWMDRMHPTLPRTLHRKKKHVGGKVVLIRDVSQSMEGRYARWTSSVVTKMIEMVRKKRMRLGYIEFNHVSRKYTHDGRFFTRDYDKIVDQAANVACSGVTNYQYPLRDALNELRRGSTHNKHIIFLTDGEPTQGDWLVREERKQARNLGVSIHTLFIGTTECPEILDILSGETDGGMFLATPDDKGALVLGERTARNLPQTPQGHGTPGQGGGKQAS